MRRVVLHVMSREDRQAAIFLDDGRIGGGF